VGARAGGPFELAQDGFNRRAKRRLVGASTLAAPVRFRITYPSCRSAGAHPKDQLRNRRSNAALYAHEHPVDAPERDQWQRPSRSNAGEAHPQGILLDQNDLGRLRIEARGGGQRA